MLLKKKKISYIHSLNFNSQTYGHISDETNTNLTKLTNLTITRFKYPPHWVPLTALWSAMLHVDAETGRSRGYMVLKSNACLEAARLALTWRWPECSDLPAMWCPPSDVNVGL